MDQIINNLTQFGLSPKQAELVVAVTKHGAKPASFLAKVIKSERTNTYKMAMSLVEKGILGQSDQHGTTVFFLPDKEVFRKQLTHHQRQISEQEKLLPQIEQSLIQLEETHHSPIPHMRFYQGHHGIRSLFEVMSRQIIDSGLRSIKCFATNTLESQGTSTIFQELGAELFSLLEQHHIHIELTFANGILLLEQIFHTNDLNHLRQAPTGHNALHFFIIQSTLYIIIYKSIPVGFTIDSPELTDVMHFLLKNLSKNVG